MRLIVCGWAEMCGMSAWWLCKTDYYLRDSLLFRQYCYYSSSSS